MKKKILSTLLIVVLSSALMAGCQDTPANTPANTSEAKAEEKKEATTQTNEVTQEVKTEAKEDVVAAQGLTDEDFEITINDTVIEIGGDMIANQETIGEPDDYSAAKSCLGTGEEKTFTYGDVTIYTKPIDSKDMIYLIEIYGSFDLKSGITIGSSLDDVEAYYGKSDDVQGSEYYYTKDSKTIGIEIKDSGVSFIEIFGDVE